jgi:ubiquitin C-terminal hydrolase
VKGCKGVEESLN